MLFVLIVFENERVFSFVINNLMTFDTLESQTLLKAIFLCEKILLGSWIFTALFCSAHTAMFERLFIIYMTNLANWPITIKVSTHVRREPYFFFAENLCKNWARKVSRLFVVVWGLGSNIGSVKLRRYEISLMEFSIWYTAVFIWKRCLTFSWREMGIFQSGMMQYKCVATTTPT